MNRKHIILAAALLIALVSISLFLTFNLLRKQTLTRPFYVGVEYAYGNQFSQLKALVDQVKDYTNLFVMGSVLLSFNETALNESCDYIFKAGLNFIVLFTTYTEYSYSIFNWIADAKQKYGDKFLGIYRFDEPGGNQLDDGQFQLINSTVGGYTQVANEYVNDLSSNVTHYLNNGAPKIFTSDYGLYWFDYQSMYSTVFAEFVGNQSRQLIVSLERGAAQSFNKDWGVIVTWKYDQAPYLESADELAADLSLAYSAGATYAVVFSYPDIGTYGTLTLAHFQALEKFWQEIHSNPGSFHSSHADVAYVIPADYGFGFRNANDTIWGLFPADALTQQIWNETQTLLTKYNSALNIIYDNPAIIGETLNSYTKVIYWNQTTT